MTSEWPRVCQMRKHRGKAIPATYLFKHKSGVEADLCTECAMGEGGVWAERDWTWTKQPKHPSLERLKKGSTEE